MPNLENIRTIFSIRGQTYKSEFKEIRKIFTPEKSYTNDFEELKRIFKIK